MKKIRSFSENPLAWLFFVFGSGLFVYYTYLNLSLLPTATSNSTDYIMSQIWRNRAIGMFLFAWMVYEFQLKKKEEKER